MSLRFRWPALLLAGVFFLGGVFHDRPVFADTVPVDGFRILNSYPHDSRAFTQGLLYHEGFLYESTGMHGQSSLRRVDLESGRVLQKKALGRQYFAEGLAVWQDRLIQLTWTSGKALVYDLQTLEHLHNFYYPGQGWGLTADAASLILSDGSDTLRFLDPQTFREVRRLQVTHAGQPVTQLNELEYVRGEILANLWHSDRIARIDPQSGRVLGWIDLSGLLPDHLQPDDREGVLNGIAWDAVNDRLFVTGKLWPRMYQIEVLPNHR